LFGGGELTAGIAIATLLTIWLRRRRVQVEKPSALFLSLVPLAFLLIYIMGVILVLHSEFRAGIRAGGLSLKARQAGVTRGHDPEAEAFSFFSSNATSLCGLARRPISLS
jgi:hypothetical protein